MPSRLPHQYLVMRCHPFHLHRRRRRLQKCQNRRRRYYLRLKSLTRPQGLNLLCHHR
jgi:hypothetical protein